MNWLYFLGRFHVLALHLPIGIIYVTIILELLSRRRRFAAMESAVGFLWMAAAVTAAGTVALGFAHYAEGGFSGESLVRHRALGVTTALASCLVVAWRTLNIDSYRRRQVLIGTFMLLLVAATGHYGGNLTHGTTYLTERAPPLLQRLLGGADASRVPIDPLTAQAFDDVVHPMLKLRCGSCHGEATRKGKLSFATYELMMKGGEDCAALVPGSLSDSEMYARITMPRDAKDFMPRDDKTPLSQDQVKIIAWYIEAGAPRSATVGSLKPPEPVLRLIGAELASRH